MKKLLMFTLIPLVLSVIAVSSVAAIGPQKAQKNPYLAVMPEGVALRLPGGVQQEWVADARISLIDFMHLLDPSKHKIRKAILPTFEELKAMFTDPEAAVEVENKWGYISHDILVEILTWMGYPEEEVDAIAAMWPIGVYIMFLNVGK